MIDTTEIRNAMKNKECWKYANDFVILQLCNEIDRLREDARSSWSDTWTETYHQCTCGTTQVCPLHQNSLTPPY